MPAIPTYQEVIHGGLHMHAGGVCVSAQVVHAPKPASRAKGKP
jgi:hypothetical protein